MLETISNAIDSVLLAVLNLLPDSPFEFLTKNAQIYNILRYVNWFLPVQQMIAVAEAWLAAVAVYFIYSIVLRWIKAVE